MLGSRYHLPHLQVPRSERRKSDCRMKGYHRVVIEDKHIISCRIFPLINISIPKLKALGLIVKMQLKLR